jgi:WD40 repeat protein
MSAPGLSIESNFYVIGGTLDRDAPSYVERRADNQLYDHLRQGQFCYALTSRQMGKSSLMVRTAARLRGVGIGVTILDLTAIGQNLSTEQWYRGLLDLMGQQLELEDELIEFWVGQRHLGPLQRWMRAIREVVMPRYLGRVVIFVDEIDAVRSLPFPTDEFFAAIRECYNRRAEDQELMRLTFCLLGVAAPSDLIRDTQTTPFNIGQRIELHDFTGDEAAPLTAGLKREERLGETLLERILHWTGGHPYLTQKLCQAVADDASVTSATEVDRLCATLFFSPRAQERDDNLLFVRERMLRGEADVASLLSLYARVYQGKRVRDDEMNPLVATLRLSGITRVERGFLRKRNRIYTRVFNQAWVKANMPDAEMRRQRTAFRRGLWRATAIASVIIAVLTGLAVIAVQQRNLAKEEASRADRNAEELRGALADAQQQRINAEAQKAEADKQRHAAINQQVIANEQRTLAEQQGLASRRSLYAMQITLAQQAWEATNIRRMTDLLLSSIPAPGQEDLRGFEWYYLWRLCHNEQATLPHANIVNAVAFSPDGKRLATAGNAQPARLWDITTGRELRTFTGYEGGLLAIAFSPDGAKLATGGKDGVVRLWDVVTGRQLATLTGHIAPVRSIAFSHDGTRLVSGGGESDSTVKVWETATGRALGRFEGLAGIASAVAFSPDDRMIASAGADRTLRLWETATGRNLKVLNFRGNVHALTFSPDGKRLAVGYGVNKLDMLDLAAGNPPVSFQGHLNPITSLAFTRDGKRLVSASWDSTVKLWDAETGQEIVTFAGHSEKISALALSPDGSQLATASQDHTVKLWSLGKADAWDSLGGVWTVAFSPDGRTVVTGSRDHTAKLWDVATGQKITTLEGHFGAVGAVAYSPNGRIVATCSEDATAKLWDAATGRELITLRGHSAGVTHVAFSPDGSKLATASHDRTVKLWQVTTGRMLQTLTGHNNSIFFAMFSPDGKRLATASKDFTARIWDLSTGRQIFALRGHNKNVWAAVFSPDGKLLASVGADRTAKIWDAATGRELTSLIGHTGAVTAAAFSPDGRRLTTGSVNGVVKIWDVSTWQELLTLKVKSGEVWPLKFSPDGRVLAAGGSDDTVKLWRTGTNDEGPANKRIPYAASIGPAPSPDEAAGWRQRLRTASKPSHPRVKMRAFPAPNLSRRNK